MKQPAKSPTQLLAPGRALTLANVAEGAEGLVVSDLARAIAARPKKSAISLAVGWPLIKLFGLRGAAITLLMNRLAGFIQHYIPVSRLLSGIPLARVVWKPISAAAVMTTYLAMPSNQPAIWRGVSATLIYAGTLLALTIWRSGGPRRFKERYLVPLSQKT